ncbi:hypothetical protein E1N52_36815 [Paraburkholderia guartelaensis]|uniref:Large polyvalent protein-associated domain-containing protein n=1 Tax=Paraburkholderia guartelaensis TaxID=2546446 RepID=A0A4R5L3I0_9BURK|nr:DUF5710 domain-containing protein [Paraburkholderia guartelaensis]TDG03003.1 hypothetical protein E1N52_36815 [Paraburkholderia guartelaensis]
MADPKRPKGKRTYLDVPFREKDAAHDLGARFDRRSKKWYVPGGTDVGPFARWIPAHEPQTAQDGRPARQPVRGQQQTLFGSEADIEREAVRLSELMGQPLDESHAFVRDSLQAAAEKAGLEARDRLRAQGASAFEMIDGVRDASVQARHQYFADRQHLYVQGARVGRHAAQPKLDDAALGRRFREMIQSITTAITLRGNEVNHTLALEQRLESIHREAWRMSGNAVDGERAIGEQIRNRTGFAAGTLPPRAAAALAKLRDEAGLSPMEIDERTPARDVTDSDPVDDAPPVDGASVAPQHRHRHREPERNDGIATFADIAEALEPVATMPATGREHEDRTDWSMVAKDLADFRELTGRISEEFGKGKIAPEVAAALDQELAFLSPAAREPFVTHVREALDRQVDASPAQSPASQAQPDVKTDGYAVTFADVGDAAAIDDAMRLRGITGNAVPGNEDVARPTVNAAAANEPVVQPGRAANDTSMDAPAVSGMIDTQIQRTQTSAQNETDAKNPANEPERPVFDSVSTQDLERVRTVRDGERAAAERLLREQGKPMPGQHAGDAGAAADAHEAGVAGVADSRDNQIGVDPASRKPVVTKDGYDVPAHVASRYLVKDGRFWKLEGMEDKPGAQRAPGATTQPHFEDVGTRLNSRQNDRATIADMVAVAKAKNWDSIVVRGSETFCRNAWIEASLADVDVKGFKPAESDEALLEAAKRERAALTIKAGTSPSPDVAQKANPATENPAAAPSKALRAARFSPAADMAAPPTPEAPKTVAQLREVLEKSLERAPARMRAEVIRRFDARMQAGTEIEARIARGELGRDAGPAEVDRRAAELHAAWTAPKAAPASGPSNSRLPAQAQTGGLAPKVM